MNITNQQLDNMYVKWQGEGWYTYTESFGWQLVYDKNDITYALHHKNGIMYIKEDMLVQNNASIMI